MEFFVYNFQKFMLVFARIMGMIMVAPFFGSQTISNRAKLGFTFFLTLVVFPLAYEYLSEVPDDMILFALIAIMEGLIGVMLGFLLTICFAAFQLAGQLFTVQMGFGASEVFDPMSQISLPLMGQYLYLVALLVFIGLKGPLLIIKELYMSFELINVENFLRYNSTWPEQGVVSFFISMFTIAMRMALPIIGTLLLVSMTMGLLAKAAPQMNLLMIGFPISITVAFLILIFILPGIIVYIEQYIDRVFKDIWFLMLEVSNGK